MFSNLNLVYLVFPVVLTVLTLILVLTLISQLRSQVKLSQLRKVTAEMETHVNSVKESFEKEAEIYTTRMDELGKRAEDLFTGTDNQIEKIAGYSRDLSEVHAAIDSYHAAIMKLNEFTAKVDGELTALDERSSLIASVQKSIDDFNTRYDQFNAQLTQFDQQFGTMLDNFTRQVSDDTSAAVSDNNQKIEAFKAEQNTVLADFSSDHNKSISDFTNSQNKVISDFREEQAGVLDAFKADQSAALSTFTSQRTAAITAFSAQQEQKEAAFRESVSKDIDTFSATLKGLEAEGVSAFSEAAEERLKKDTQIINDCLEKVSREAKELVNELSEKSAAIRELVGGFDQFTDEKIKELLERYQTLSGEKKEIAELAKIREAALDDIKRAGETKLGIQQYINGHQETIKALKLEQAELEKKLADGYKELEDLKATITAGEDMSRQLDTLNESVSEETDYESLMVSMGEDEDSAPVEDSAVEDEIYEDEDDIDHWTSDDVIEAEQALNVEDETDPDAGIWPPQEDYSVPDELYTEDDAPSDEDFLSEFAGEDEEIEAEDRTSAALPSTYDFVESDFYEDDGDPEEINFD